MTNLDKAIMDSEVRMALRKVASHLGWEKPTRSIWYREESGQMHTTNTQGIIVYAFPNLHVYGDAIIGEGQKNRQFPDEGQVNFVSLNEQGRFDRWNDKRKAKYREAQRQADLQYELNLAAWDLRYKDVPDRVPDGKPIITHKEIDKPHRRMIGIPVVNGEYGILVKDYQHRNAFLDTITVKHAHNQMALIPREFGDLELSCADVKEVFQSLCVKYEVKGLALGKSLHERIEDPDNNPLKGYEFQYAFNRDSFSTENLERAVSNVYAAGEAFWKGIDTRRERLAQKEKVVEKKQQGDLLTDFDLKV